MGGVDVDCGVADEKRLLPFDRIGGKKGIDDGRVGFDRSPLLMADYGLEKLPKVAFDHLAGELGGLIGAHE